MIRTSAVALAASLVLSLGGSAFAQNFNPKVPDPSDPYPTNPIATNGTPLPRGVNTTDTLYTGRSAYVGGPAGIVGGAVDAAGSIVGTGVGAAGAVVDGGLNTVGAGTSPYGYAR